MAVHAADLLDGLSEIVFQTDPEGNWTYLNQAWTRATGFPVEDSLGRNFMEYVHPDERQRTIELFTAVVSGGATFCHHEGRYRTATGEFSWMELRATVRYDDAGVMVGNSGTMFDITARREAQEILDEQTGILELIAQDAPLHQILGCLTQSAARRCRCPIRVLVVPTIDRVTKLGKLDVQSSRLGRLAEGDVTAVMVAQATPDGVVQHSLYPQPGQLTGRETQPIAESLSGVDYPIRSQLTKTELGRFVLYQDASIAVTRSVKQIIERCTRLASLAITRAQTEEKMRRQALEDPLTGLPNRALLRNRFEQAIEQAGRSGGRVGLVIFDLDRFKDINDTLGHEVGDRVLRHVAAQIEATIPPSDTLARLGGDEFALLMPDLRDVDEAELTTARALAALQEQLPFDGAVLKLTASAGIAMHPTHGSDPSGLFRRADVAMYRAKRLGGRVAVYDPLLDQDQLESLTFVAELQHAIGVGELALLYQPKVSLKTGAAVGVECLVRWHHPRHGLIPPSQFIPFAESTGLIKPLTVWVMRQALQDAALWHEQGMDMPVAINLSAALLHDPELPHVITRERGRRGPHPGALELEITESAVMQDPNGALKTISLLRSVGIAFALDDFGTGYSSLAYLKNLPVQSIKIDQSFIRDMVTDPRDASIVRAAIELGHNFGLEIVAEGVESARVHELLTRLDCDHAQGFHFARPMTRDAVLARYDRREQENPTKNDPVKPESDGPAGD